MNHLTLLLKDKTLEFLGSIITSGATFKLITEASPERSTAEIFIVEQFNKHHSACISEFHPNLMAQYDKDGQLCSVVGFRFAEHHELFLESYLDNSIENTIDSQYPINRKKLVEIGNLASIKKGTCRALIQYLGFYFLIHGYTWVVFTGTQNIRASFRKLDIELLTLAKASLRKIENNDDRWGSYYDNDPIVVAGHIPSSLKKITAYFISKQLQHINKKPATRSVVKHMNTSNAKEIIS